MKRYKLPKKVEEIFQKFKKNNLEIYAVGGCVRDLLMKQPTHDWDFTTNATPQIIKSFFPDSFYDNKFGTVGIPVNDEIYEITTYRTERGYSDRRHPDKVAWGKSLEDDLSRRDFTINAIAFDCKNFIDVFKGKEDLDNKLIRAVGDPDERFKEDALRLLRAIRIATQLQFFIEKKTLAAIKNDSILIQNVSNERIRDELIKILSSDFASDGFLFLRNTTLLKYIIPELDQTFNVAQKSPKRHHIYDVGTHSIMSLKFCPSKDPIVRLATLLHDVGKTKTARKEKGGVITFYNHEVIGASIAKQIARRLRFSKKDQERLVRLIRWHQFSVDERQTDSAIRRIIRRVGKKNLKDILDLRIGDRLGGGARETSWRLELFKKRLIQVQKQPFSITDLKIDGYDMMKIFDIKPGPRVGEILQQVFLEVLNKKTKNQRTVLLKRLKELKIQKK